MGRLTKKKIDKIAKLRQEGFTQKETAEEVGVHLRTVRKYDPLKEKRKPTPEQIKEKEESCIKLVALGLAEEIGGRFRISSLGRQAYEKYEELKERAILCFMAEKDRPVREEEVQRYIDSVDEELFNEAVNEVMRQRD
jgi:predicted transcriptional regulator